MKDKPLISFCLMCYNQEKYIEEALNSALAQDYSPLEIIVSDDCSTDNSFALIQKIASDYHGPHHIILHRNEVNQGMIKNWLTLCHLSSGELIFKADGDDVSLPNRVSVVVSDWLNTNKEAVLISHSYLLVNLEGEKIGEVRLPKDGWDTRTKKDIYNGNGFFHPGAGSAYQRCLVDSFGDVSEYRAADDAVFVGRAIMLGRLRTISTPLVKYRVGSGLTSLGHKYRESIIRGLKFGYYSQIQVLHDLDFLCKSINKEAFDNFKETFEERLKHHEDALKLWNGRTFRERWNGYQKVKVGKILSVQGIIQIICLFPNKIGNIVFQLLLRLKKK